jgi:hypothetical protein
VIGVRNRSKGRRNPTLATEGTIGGFRIWSVGVISAIHEKDTTGKRLEPFDQFGFPGGWQIVWQDLLAVLAEKDAENGAIMDSAAKKFAPGFGQKELSPIGPRMGHPFPGGFAHFFRRPKRLTPKKRRRPENQSRDSGMACRGADRDFAPGTQSNENDPPCSRGFEHRRNGGYGVIDHIEQGRRFRFPFALATPPKVKTKTGKSGGGKLAGRLDENPVGPDPVRSPAMQEDNSNIADVPGIALVQDPGKTLVSIQEGKGAFRHSPILGRNDFGQLDSLDGQTCASQDKYTLAIPLCKSPQNAFRNRPIPVSRKLFRFRLVF